MDAKLYVKRTTARLGLIFGDLIHQDQVGFVPTRQAQNNTLKTFSVTHQVSFPHCLMLFLDAIKAFDLVVWVFLRVVLANININPVMLQRIVALHQPHTQIRMNGSPSQPFNIQNGNRQGCQLSSLLFPLVMEHLMKSIRVTVDVKGIQIEGNALLLWTNCLFMSLTVILPSLH